MLICSKLFGYLDVAPNILNCSRCFLKHTQARLCQQLQLLRASVGSPQSPCEGAAGKPTEGDWEGNETLSNLFGLRLLLVIC